MLDFESMSYDEVLKISLEKNSKGNATRDALEAQKYLWIQAGCPLNDICSKWNNGLFQDDGFGLSDNYADLYDKIIKR